MTEAGVKTAPFGSWKSPISSELVSKSGVGLLQVRVDCNTQLKDTVYWSELRYEENGRCVVCSYSQGADIQEWTPKDFNARSTVHEYGGGDFFVYNDAVYFSNLTDQVLYMQKSPNDQPQAVTDASKKWRYADGVVCPKTGQIYCVREDHEVIAQGAKEAENTVVTINPTTHQQTILAKGKDFYAHPRVSFDGKKICWFEWNHPNMPWDDTEVWVADLDSGGCGVVEGSERKVAGGPGESAVEPGWTPDHRLLYISDRTDWWNLYHVSAAADTHVNLCPHSTEIAGPQWYFGKAAYVADPAGSSKILTSQDYTLGVMDTANPDKYETFDTGFRYNECLALSASGDAYFIGSGYHRFPCIVRFNINTKEVKVIKESMSVAVDPGYLNTQPRFIQWETANRATCHGIFYPPANKDFRAPDGSKPPVLVRPHGGPTDHYFAKLDLQLQYFTSRGFAVLLVNYRGSSGQGRSYRKLLQNNWGVVDVEDCCSGVEHLVRLGEVDGEKSCIDGASAGGYTTLACLAFKDTFKAGASHYGMGDMKALMEETHKFESHYLDGLLLPLDDPNAEAIYKERSPVHHATSLNCPIALFHGDQDKVVPPNQAQMMHKVLLEKKIPCMLVMFEGEQHGFVKAENIQAALDGEFYFFGRVLGFTPADHIKGFKIDNLD